ncbi:hypothetical protein TPB0596_28630 [Tsukamurella pulmonis]|uniref:GNAT family N-acetyltransferase n=1 Tax=Tsukamurella pulmonis TaxID=47312 RepID=UPI001EDCF33E|nr:GNAT family N-acetyltransferase [Tsukamurella pulmonis]BDD83100.1 hypothetical protein TPB0596_28630 [Tsukamurella pulmonis]
MTTQSNSGRYRFGDRIIELRTSRLSDGRSWRRTNLEHEERLRPAFGSPSSDWDAEHSATAWAQKWLADRSGVGIPLSRLILLEEGDTDRVVGQQAYAGPDPRTGHAESSTWIAGLDDSSKVAVWLCAMNMLELFRLHPQLTWATAPLAVTNAPAIALAKAVNLTWINDMRGFREYSGVPIDHTLYAGPNTPEYKDHLEKLVASLGVERVAPRRAAAPSPEALLGLARAGVRRARARRGAGASSGAAAVLLPAATTEDGHAIAFVTGPDQRYTVTADGTRIGQVQITVDPGTSTTELIEWLRPDAPKEIATAATVAACRVLAERQNTRRLTVALADRHAGARDPLIGIDFVSEGQTLPTIGDADSPREMFTRYREQ